MRNSSPEKTQTGSALTGIVIILSIFIIGGIYFYESAKKTSEDNQAMRERAAADNPGIELDANVLKSNR